MRWWATGAAGNAGEAPDKVVTVALPFMATLQVGSEVKEGNKEKERKKKERKKLTPNGPSKDHQTHQCAASNMEVVTTVCYS